MMRPAAVALLSALVCISFVPVALAAGPLFPQPMHLTRQVHDPISGTTTVLEEYAQGNRLVSVRGPKTSIADYDKNELMEIDREAGTYSITRFDALARASHIVGADAPAAMHAKSDQPMRSAGMRASKLGRNAEVFEAELDGDVKAKLEIAVDRTALVSKNALEVLLGSAYPGVHRPEHDAVIAAASSQRGGGRGVSANSADGGDALYALPVEQSIRYEIDGQSVELRTSVVRLGSETPPADLLSIPAGARLVVSRLVAVSEELERLDRATPSPSADRH